MNTKQYLSIILTAASACAAAQTSDTSLDPTDMAYPVVITPTRLRQSLADVPASVTVITAETIRRYGIQSVDEALMLVPGMAVSRAVGNEYHVNYHGTYAALPRRLNVLVDGVSVYRPALSRVEWAQLPVVLEDIDHIEVIRGPDSSAYGPNSMMAIINILTKHPKDVERGLVSVSAGAHQRFDVTARLGTTLGPTSLRATVNVQHDGGFDNIGLFGGSHDSADLKRLNLRAQSDLSDGSSLDLQASIVQGTLELGYASENQLSYPDADITNTQFSARWTKALSANHELQVDFFRTDARAVQQWTSCAYQFTFLPQLYDLFQSNPTYTMLFVGGNPNPPGGSAQDQLLLNQAKLAMFGLGASAYQPICGQVNRDGAEGRTHLEVQDTFVASDTLRFVAGLGARYQYADNQTYFGGKVSNRVHWVFGHMEYRPTKWLTANVGGYFESNSLSGQTFSPRLALNAHLSDNQTLRFVVSEGTRSPDLFEQKANWSYTATNLTPPALGATTARWFLATHAKSSSLVSERILSKEVGYLLTLRHIGLNLDVKVFDDQLTHLISKNLDMMTFGPANSDAVRLTGAEMQTSWDINTDWSGMLNYAYLLNREATSPSERMQYARHSGSIGISRALPNHWRAAMAYYGSSGDGLFQSRYARTDLTVSHAFNLADRPGSASLTLSYLDTPNVTNPQDLTRYFVSSFNNRLSMHAQVRMAF